MPNNNVPFLVWILAKVIIFRLADGAWTRVRGRGCVDEQVAPWIGLGCYSMWYSTPSEQFDSFRLDIPDSGSTR